MMKNLEILKLDVHWQHSENIVVPNQYQVIIRNLVLFLFNILKWIITNIISCRGREYSQDE